MESFLASAEIPIQNAKEYADLLKSHNIDYEALSYLDHKLLSEIGILSMGHRIKIINHLRNQAFLDHSSFMRKVESVIEDPISRQFWVQELEMRDLLAIEDLVDSLKLFCLKKGVPLQSGESIEIDSWHTEVVSGIAIYLGRDQKSDLNMQEFGIMMKTFGPVYSLQIKDSGVTLREPLQLPFTAKLMTLCKLKYFFGDISEEKTKEIFHTHKGSNQFMLRIEKQTGSYVVSFRDRSGITHKPITKLQGQLSIELNLKQHNFNNEWNLIKYCKTLGYQPLIVSPIYEYLQDVDLLHLDDAGYLPIDIALVVSSN